MVITEVKALLYSTERNGKRIYRIRIPALFKNDEAFSSGIPEKIGKSAQA